MNNLTEKDYLKFLGVDREQLKTAVTTGGASVITDLAGCGVISGLIINPQEVPDMSIKISDGELYNHLGIKKSVRGKTIIIEPVNIEDEEEGGLNNGW